MKINTVLIFVALLAYWLGLCNASAFYDPGAQRWLNRDPLREKTFESIRNVYPIKTRNILQPGEFAEGPNLYLFVHNNTINRHDLRGLEDGDIRQPIDPYLPKRTHPYDPSCPDDRADLRDCFNQAQAFDNAVFKKTGDHLTSSEYMKVVEDCMKDKGHIYPPPEK